MHIGSISLTEQITLHNVFHVPDFHFNLISVKRLCQDMHCQLVFTNDKCYVQDILEKKQPILLGSQKSGLYNVEAQKLSSTTEAQQVCCTSLAEAQK